jgi:gas vesicle protein
MESNNKMAGGLLLGLAIGAIAGALLSPRSGRENLTMLQDKMGEIGDMMKKGRSRMQSEIEDALPSRDSDYLH